MADRPIIFSGPMVGALIEGRKTQTRRVLCQFDPERDPPSAGPYFAGHKAATWTDSEGAPWRYPGAKGAATGDRLYVREAWRCSAKHDATAPRDLIPRSMTIAFEAGGNIANQDSKDDWRPSPASYTEAEWMGRARPSIHMPRWASRLTLTVTDVRVQRLQDISEADAVAEGIERLEGSKGPNHFTREITGKWSGSFNAPTAQEVFADLWNSLHGPAAWDANPWVVAVTFTVEQRNIDAGGA